MHDTTLGPPWGSQATVMGEPANMLAMRLLSVAVTVEVLQTLGRTCGRPQ